MRVMLGITGASGAPYAARILRGLVEAGADVGVCASGAGAQVIALELYGDRSMDPHGALERLVADHSDAHVRIWEQGDYSAPYASGSSRTDAVVVCPCSMATVGTIAGGAEANLIHRAAAVQLKEGRKLVLVPRETPLSDIHLENLLRVRRAGAMVLPAMPGFYHLPRTIDDLVDFVAGRVLDAIGVDQTMAERWGASAEALPGIEG
jgi:4-hydroxy-3-polyprenylbenzoate decarboxylase